MWRVGTEAPTLLASTHYMVRKKLKTKVLGLLHKGIYRHTLDDSYKNQQILAAVITGACE